MKIKTDKYGELHIIINIFVNYDKYGLFISHMAHEYKRLGFNGLKEKYKNNQFKGVYKRYYNAYILYLENKSNKIEFRCSNIPKVVTLDPIYYEIIKLTKDFTLIQEAIDKSKTEFLYFGLTMEDVQEAVKCIQ